MTIFRTYFTKNNTISSNNFANFAKNPVAEIAHFNNGLDSLVTRYIFDINTDEISQRLNSLDLGENINVRHVLNLTNTVRYSGNVPQYSYDKNIERAKSSDLELVSVNEDWDEGNGYTFTYNKNSIVSDGSNWINKRTDVNWLTEGYYTPEHSEQLYVHHFDNGNENIEIDITDYVVNRISGGTISQGLMLKFTDEYEDIYTEKIKSIAFHTKDTNTVFEPYVETIIDDEIHDDRTRFHRDVDQKLFFNMNLRNNDEFTLNNVKIVDYENRVYDSIPTNNIVKVNKNNYYVNVRIDSLIIPDHVICYDVWEGTLNKRLYRHTDEFYIQPDAEKYFAETRNIDSYDIKISGLKENERVSIGKQLKIILYLRNIFDYSEEVVAKYRLFFNVGKDYEVDVIPLTKFNKSHGRFNTILDTSWLLPNKYVFEYLIETPDGQELREQTHFVVPSNKILK